MSNDKFWSSFGKISLVVGVISGIIYLSSEIGTKEPKIITICSYNSFDIPPDIQSTLRSTWDYNTWDNLEVFIDSVKNKESHTNRIISYLRDYVHSFYPKSIQSGRSPYSSFFNFTIFNEGDLVANDLVLDGPSPGLCRIVNRDNSQTVVAFNHTLSLGSIRPGDEIKVYLWTTSSIYHPDDDFRITYSDGIGKIRFPSTHYGFKRWVGDNIGLILLFSIFTLVFFVLFTLAYISDSSSENADEEEAVREDSTGNTRLEQSVGND